MKKIALLLLLACVVPLAAAIEGSEGIREEFSGIAKHIEFLSYTLARATDEVVYFTHEKKLNVGIKKYFEGFLFFSNFTGSAVSKNDQDGFLKMVNNMNLHATLCRYYVDGDGDLCIEAWFPGTYEKQKFATFFEAWEKDWQTAVDKEGAAMRRYLE